MTRNERTTVGIAVIMGGMSVVAAVVTEAPAHVRNLTRPPDDAHFPVAR